MSDLDLVIRTIVDEQIEVRVAEEVERRLARLERAEVSPFLTVRQAAAFLCCSEQRIRDLLSQRKLDTVKEGGSPEHPRSGRTLVKRSQLEGLTWQPK